MLNVNAGLFHYFSIKTKEKQSTPTTATLGSAESRKRGGEAAEKKVIEF